MLLEREIYITAHMLQSRSGRATHGICSKKEWYAVGLITVPLIHVPLVALTCKCFGQTCSVCSSSPCLLLPERQAAGRRRALFDRSMQAVCARRHRLHFNRLKFGATNLTRLEHSSGFAHLLLPRGERAIFSLSFLQRGGIEDRGANFGSLFFGFLWTK